MLDVNALQTKTGDWLRDAASASVPPALTSFFSVHSVFGDGPKRRQTWLHTHGLHRMGSIELDIVGIRRREAPALGELINHVARFFIDRGVPLPNARFEAGNSLPLVWPPLGGGAAARGSALGGAADRDADHGGERESCSRRRRRPERLEPPRYAPVMEADPIFYVSPAETERMQRLARERLPPSHPAGQVREEPEVGLPRQLGIPSTRDGRRDALALAERSISGSTSTRPPRRPWMPPS
jgi:hypothetical protein